MKDYYGVFGLGREADQEEIKRAYRRLARQYHPDVNPDDGSAEGKFKEAAEAYEVLSDPEKRRRYDLFGESGLGQMGFGADYEGFGAPFGDIFEMFFRRGSGRSRRGSSRGSDLLYALEISLEEAYRGIERGIEVPRHERCEDCEGTGVGKGYSLEICPQCGGQGTITATRRTAFGTFSSSTACHRCGGSGEINLHPCIKCGGDGLNEVRDKISLDIPAGVDERDRIRIPGKGESGGRGGLAGDLYVEVRIAEDDTFTRRGSDLHAVVALSMVEAALGTEVPIKTFAGEETLRVNAGSQPGEVFRLRGKGMPKLNSKSKGDLYLTLEVRVPKKLNGEQRKLLEDYQELEARGKEAPNLMQRLRKAMRQ